MPHRLHAVHRGGLLLPMSHVVWPVCLCVSVSVGHTGELCKTAEPIEMLFAGGGLTLVNPRHHVLNEGQGRTNRFTAARDDKTVMRPFAKLRWILVVMNNFIHLER